MPFAKRKSWECISLMLSERVMILGADGYIGYGMMCYLMSKGHAVLGVDNLTRRMLVEEQGSASLTPIISARERGVLVGDIREHGKLKSALARFKPTVVINYAQQPSAPYSMQSAMQAMETQYNNLMGTLSLIFAVRDCCPNVPIIELGTMGEYSDWIYNGIPIPESNQVEVRFQNGIYDDKNYDDLHITIPTPKSAGSFYHWSKIFSSFNLEFACKLWGLSATNINQGVVYGSRLPDLLKGLTRFDYDETFGTVVNRFVVQAVMGIPLTVYGEGGQTRGFINLKDSIRAVELCIANPPEAGEFRIVNQITEVLSVNDIAVMVGRVTGATIEHVQNPRVEKEKHKYNVAYEKLKDWGLTESYKMVEAIPEMVADVKRFKNRVKTDVIQPRTQWRVTA